MGIESALPHIPRLRRYARLLTGRLRYSELMAGYRPVTRDDTTFDIRDSAPVVRVSWTDAQDFVRWLNQVDGPGWRLPTEAEWEYACRAGGGTRFCAVPGNESRSAWTADNSGSQVHPVGMMLPNAWGVHDMSGNALEWVQDCWADSFAAAPSDGSAVQAANCGARVLRGGGANSSTWETRAAARASNSPDYRGNLYGFRLARSVR